MAHKLKAQLVKNHLTPEANDYVGIVESFGSANNAAIVDELVAEGMELKRETALDVIARYERKCIDLTLRGYSVSTPLVHMHATIKGAFHDKTWSREANHLHVSLAQGAELRKAVGDTTVEVIGEKADPIALFSITNLKTGATDGSVSPGFNAELKGAYIKVAGDDPSCGVYLRGLSGQDDVKLEASSIVLNEPSRLLLLVPAGTRTGAYELRVVTQYTIGSKPLQHPRTVTLSGSVVVA
ncbi:MAG: DUF4469 domain-containing protein [Prevotellaceae bacterium]|jgi:hypothetical protein|nr:DUF4469 domain-containing protein [Prevotellaceae bacterium]